MAAPQKIRGRYEVKEIIGRGGMGLVYKAYDSVVGREVALKTVSDVYGKAALDLFYKEWRILANLHHPNIVEIFDIGDFEEEGAVRPFFVMPLLRGLTLDQLIHGKAQNLTPERLSEIVVQVCNGLHATHESGLVHRDLKPSNIFVMEYNSVKLIDFGVAHLLGGESRTSLKGTVWYMAPEQIQARECTPASDIFSLGVVCYEALTGSRPFQGGTSDEIFEAIVSHIPAPVSDLNPAVSQSLSRVIHKAMAKQPRNRFASATEFAESLVKALRNEPIEHFDPARIQPRIQRAMRAFEQSNFQLAADILSDLEAAGHIDPALTPLRRQIHDAIRRQTVRTLLDRAQTGFAEEEFALAQQSVEQVLKLDSANKEAQDLQRRISEATREKQVKDWISDARSLIAAHAFSRARLMLNNVLEALPNDPVARELMADLESKERTYRQARQEKEKLYQDAREAWQNFECATALKNLRRVLDLEEQAPDTAGPEGRANYLSFFNLVQAAQAYFDRTWAEARALAERGQYARVLEICAECLTKYPGHPLFQALKSEIEERQKQESGAELAGFLSRAAAEDDLEKRMAILQEALARFPHEPYIEQWLAPLRDRLTAMNAIALKARMHEEHGRMSEAKERWMMVLACVPGHAAADAELQRLGGYSLDVTGDSRPARANETIASPPARAGDAPSSAAPPEERGASGAAVWKSWRKRIGEAFTACLASLRGAAQSYRATAGAAMAFASSSAGRAGGRSITTASRWMRRSRYAPWVLAPVFAAMLIVLSAAIVTRLRTDPPPPPLIPVPVTIQTTPSGATVRIGDLERMANPAISTELRPGSHVVRATLAGFAPVEQTVVVEPDKPLAIPLKLTPLPTLVRVLSEVPKTELNIGEGANVALQEGEYEQSMDPGAPEVAIRAGGRRSVVQIETAAGRIPQVRPGKNTDLPLAAVASFGGSMRAYRIGSAGKVSADGGAEADIPDDGLELKGVQTLVFSLGPGRCTLPVAASPSPALTFKVCAEPERDEGTLVVSTGQEEFEVFIDGKPQTRKIRRGAMRIGNLAPKEYTIRVGKAGFQQPPERVVTLRKGFEEKVDFELQPIPEIASIHLSEAPRGTLLLIDGQVVCTATDGSCNQNVNPGPHEIELKNRPAYRDKPLGKRLFEAGKPLRIAGADARMDKLPGTVRMQVAPGVTVTYQCVNEPERTMDESRLIRCPEGSVRMTGKAPGFNSNTETIVVAPGVTVDHPLQLHESAKPAPPRSFNMQDLLKLSGWKTDAEGRATTQKGGDLPGKGIAGVYEFTVVHKKSMFGDPKMSWTIQRDGGRLDFAIDRRAFYSGGKPVEAARREPRDTSAIQIEITAGSVVHRIQSGADWKEIPAMNDPQASLLSGPVRITSEAAISEFRFREIK